MERREFITLFGGGLLAGPAPGTLSKIIGEALADR